MGTQVSAHLCCSCDQPFHLSVVKLRLYVHCDVGLPVLASVLAGLLVQSIFQSVADREVQQTEQTTQANPATKLFRVIVAPTVARAPSGCHQAHMPNASYPTFGRLPIRLQLPWATSSSLRPALLRFSLSRASARSREWQQIQPRV